MFLHRKVRMGVLPQMLLEILRTRYIKFCCHYIIVGVLNNCRCAEHICLCRETVKRRIKQLKAQLLLAAMCDKASISDHIKMLDARQLSLKMIANVTYGYTAAGYSGRMPCVDIADSVVQTGIFNVWFGYF